MAKSDIPRHHAGGRRGAGAACAVTDAAHDVRLGNNTCHAAVGLADNHQADVGVGKQRCHVLQQRVDRNRDQPRTGDGFDAADKLGVQFFLSDAANSGTPTTSFTR